jgi:hypothetical protein
MHRVIRAFWSYLKQRREQRVDAPVDEMSVESILNLRTMLSGAFWDDPTDVEQLQEPILSWHLARPGLFLAAILMVGLATILNGHLVQASWLNFKRLTRP